MVHRIGRLVMPHKDRMLGFGVELVFAICESKHVEVRILNQCEELTQDVCEIIMAFSARLDGSRSRKNRKLLDGEHAEEETSSCSIPTMGRRRTFAKRQGRPLVYHWALDQWQQQYMRLESRSDLVEAFRSRCNID